LRRFFGQICQPLHASAARNRLFAQLARARRRLSLSPIEKTSESQLLKRNQPLGQQFMAQGKFVSYLRVSTARQGQSGLGLEAQRKGVEDYLNGGKWQLIQEFVEVESGKNNDRAELAKAKALCRLRNATLVIAKNRPAIARCPNFGGNIRRAMDCRNAVPLNAARFPRRPEATLLLLVRKGFSGRRSTNAGSLTAGNGFCFV
jgi:Resolvase, N terminal domain